MGEGTAEPRSPNLPPRAYRPRIAERELDDRLRSRGAVVVEGPKACGKTWTALQRAASVVHLDVDAGARRAIEVDPTLVLNGSTPRLPDEWQMPDYAPIPHWTDAVALAAALHGDELILAGLLHDVVEDTDATFPTIEKRFGTRVQRLVRAVSKDDEAMEATDGRPIPPKPRTSEEEADLWRRRPAFMLQHVHGDAVDADVLRLEAADAFVNLGAILRGRRDPEVGPSVWKRFKVGADASLWFYQSIVDAVMAGIGDEPFAHDLREMLASVRAAS